MRRAPTVYPQRVRDPAVEAPDDLLDARGEHPLLASRLVAHEGDALRVIERDDGPVATELLTVRLKTA